MFAHIIFSYSGTAHDLMRKLNDACIAEDEEREIIDLRVQRLMHECETGVITYDQYLLAVRKLYRVGVPVPQPNLN